VKRFPVRLKFRIFLEFQGFDLFSDNGISLFGGGGCCLFFCELWICLDFSQGDKLTVEARLLQICWVFVQYGCKRSGGIRKVPQVIDDLFICKIDKQSLHVWMYQNAARFKLCWRLFVTKEYCDRKALEWKAILETNAKFAQCTWWINPLRFHLFSAEQVDRLLELY